MSRSTYRKVNGEWKWIDLDESAPEPVAPFIHQDSFKPGMRLRHPVTDELVDSKSRWAAINKAEGLTCVGNDLLSKRRGRGPEKLTEEVILDRIHRAEAIQSDPSKLRAARERNFELQERNRRLLNGN